MKIRLGSDGDLDKLEEVLAASVRRYMEKQVSSKGITEDQATILREQLGHMAASVLEKLKHNILVEAGGSDENSDPKAALSKGNREDSFLPARDEDDETLALLSELRVLSEKAAEQRSVVPAMVKEKLMGQLETLRPSTEELGPIASTAANTSLEPAPEDLRKQLSEATDNMPHLRARLEEALSRLQRVVEAVEAEHSRPLPSTVEKAVEGEADFVQDGGASPAVKAAMASGKISTRRRLARDLRPVPYPM